MHRSSRPAAEVCSRHRIRFHWCWLCFKWLAGAVAIQIALVLDSINAARASYVNVFHFLSTNGVQHSLSHELHVSSLVRLSRSSFASHTVSVDSDTTIHCWIPASLRVSNDSNKSHQNPKPVLLLIPGFGVHAIWHWNAQAGPLSRYFYIIVPDLLLFCGGSSSRRSEVCLKLVAREIFVVLYSSTVKT